MYVPYAAGPRLVFECICTLCCGTFIMGVHDVCCMCVCSEVVRGDVGTYVSYVSAVSHWIAPLQLSLCCAHPV